MCGTVRVLGKLDFHALLAVAAAVGELGFVAACALQLNAVANGDELRVLFLNEIARAADATKTAMTVLVSVGVEALDAELRHSRGSPNSTPIARDAKYRLLA